MSVGGVGEGERSVCVNVCAGWVPLAISNSTTSLGASSCCVVFVVAACCGCNSSVQPAPELTQLSQIVFVKITLTFVKKVCDTHSEDTVVDTEGTSCTTVVASASSQHKELMGPVNNYG